MPKEEIANTEKQAEEGEAQTVVTMRGKPQKVLKGLQDITQGSGKDKEKETDTTRQFSELLKNPAYTVRAERKRPLKLDDQELVNKVEIETPTNLTQIKKYLEEEYGGKNWFLGVWNEDGQKLGGLNIEINARPLPRFAEDLDEEFEFGSGQPRGIRGGLPFSGGEPETDIIDEQEALLKKQAKMTMLKNFIRENKGEGDGELKQMIAKLQDNVNQNIAQLKAENERKIQALQEDKKEEMHRREIEELRKFNSDQLKLLQDQMMKQTELMMAQIKEIKNDKSQANQNSNAEMFKVLSENQTKMMEVMNKSLESKINSMAEMNKSSIEIFKEIIGTTNQQFKDLIGQITNKSENTIDSFNGLLGLIRSFNEASGLVAIPEPQDFGSKLINAVQEIAPQVLETIKAKREAGKEMSKEELVDSIVNNLQPFIQETVRQAYEEKIKQPVQPQIPAKTTQPVQNQPPTQSPPLQKGEEMSPELIVKNNVNGILRIINSEISQEPLPEKSKCVEAGLQYLPDNILNELVNCKDEKETILILKKYGDMGLIVPLGMRLMADSKKMDWVKKQFQTLIDEYKKKKNKG